MSRLEINSYGKINLALDVIKRREDNYHEINTIMQSIDLKDRLIIEDYKEGEVIIQSNVDTLPSMEDNLVYKAYKILSNKFNIKRGVKVYIEKNIPMGAGLAGGSGNAASMLKGLNTLWNLGLSEKELIDIGVNIGADVPFCIKGGTCIAKGIGEKLTSTESFKGKDILICNPGINISTKDAYEILKLDDNRIDIDSLARCIESNDLYGMKDFVKNKMEEGIFKLFPEIGEIKEKLVDLGAVFALMSGSGSTVFGVFDSKEKMNYAKNILEKEVKLVIACKTL